MHIAIVVRHLVVAVLVVSAACRRGQPASSVSDSTFVAVMADLKRVHEATGLDSAQRATRRDSILQSRGLTAARLDSAARALARNPTRAQTVWQAIDRRAADTTAAVRPDSAPSK
jgi:hypothetical protein